MLLMRDQRFVGQHSVIKSSQIAAEIAKEESKPLRRYGRGVNGEGRRVRRKE